MRYFLLGTAIGASLFANQLTWADETPPASSQKPAASGQTDPAAASSGETWRFRYHRSAWWYWLPSEQWVIWSDGEWVSPENYQAQAAPARRSYSYRPQRVDRQYGAWGPVRYDRFGQPQYPYSRRKTGLRQLGPVPAYGGVRALPGWGGER